MLVLNRQLSDDLKVSLLYQYISDVHWKLIVLQCFKKCLVQYNWRESSWSVLTDTSDLCQDRDPTEKFFTGCKKGENKRLRWDDRQGEEAVDEKAVKRSVYLSCKWLSVRYSDFIVVASVKCIDDVVRTLASDVDPGTLSPRSCHYRRLW